MDKKRTAEVTDVAPVVQTDVRMTTGDITSTTQRHARQHVLSVLGCTERTLQRYMAELRASRALDTAQGARGATLFSDDDVEFLRSLMGRKSERAQAGRSATQSERIARYAAALGGRREAEALKRELSAVEGGVRKRVAALLWHAPQVASLGARGRVLAYLWLWHSTDLDSLPDEAPWVGTIERAFRAVVADT